MSLILEALKKSESRRRLGEAPDLGTPFSVARRRRNPLPWIVVLIVAAGAFGWWYVRTPPATGDTTLSASGPRRPAAVVTAPAGTPQRPAPAGSAPARAPATPAVTGAPVAPPPARAANAAAANRMQPGSVFDGNPSQPAPPGTSTMRAATRNTLPQVAPPPVAATSPSAAPTSPAVRPTLAAPTPPAAASPAPAPSIVASGPGAPKSDPNAAANAGNAGAAAAAPPAAPAGPPLPLYYELPYSTRKDIPPIVLSMHVFSPDTATRFVVVDGERKTQGDSLKEGLKLDEIRPDGMVLEFHGQRFFYPRSGH